MFGDLPLTTWDGFVYEVDLNPAIDGVIWPLPEGVALNEMEMDIYTK